METALVPMAELRQMAEVLGERKMFGKSAEELLPLMLIAQAEHKHPAIAAQEYDIIQGRPAINSKSALARFQAAGGRIQWGDRTDAVCTATFAHPQGGELTVSWTMERAKQAGLTGKDNWRKYPTQMLSARVIAEGVRACFPACLSGLYTAEEVQDMPPLAVPETPREEPPMRDVTPEPPAMYGEEQSLRDEFAALLNAGALAEKDRDAIIAWLAKEDWSADKLREGLARAKRKAAPVPEDVF